VAGTDWPKPTAATPSAVTASQASTVRRRGTRLRTLTQSPPRIEVTHRAIGKTTPQVAGIPKETAIETAPISIAAIEAEPAAPHTSHSRMLGVRRRRLRTQYGPGAGAVGMRGSRNIGPIPSSTIAHT